MMLCHRWPIFAESLCRLRRVIQMRWFHLKTVKLMLTTTPTGTLRTWIRRTSASDHNFLKNKFTKILPAWLCADVTALLPLFDVLIFAFGPLLAHFAYDISSMQRLRHIVESPRPQLQYNHNEAEWSNSSSQCGTQRLFALENDTETWDLRASSAYAKKKSKCLEGQSSSI